MGMGEAGWSFIKFVRCLVSITMWLSVFFAVVRLGSGGVFGADRVDPPGALGAVRGDDGLVRAVVTTEETLLVLSRRLDILTRGLLDLRLPGPRDEAAAVFASVVSILDLGSMPDVAVLRSPDLDYRAWPLASTAGSSSRVDLWRTLLDGVGYFEHARFSLVDGEHPGGDPFRFTASCRFDAVAWMKSGTWQSLEGKVGLTWERSPSADGPAGEWQITGWRTESMAWNVSPRRLFAEALDTVLLAPQNPADLRRSQHFEATVRYYREGMKKLPHPYFAPISVNQKEGLAVADINGDGWDDIYIPVRLGRNLLLMNQGDGTFSEEGSKYGLDLPGHTTCAVFADFDNDGDLDAMLGRSLLKTTYLENRAGVFHQVPIPAFMPMAVISMAAADYNNDGLLDVYLCTYRPAAPAGAGASGGFGQVAKEGDFDWPDEFFPPEQAREFRRRVADHRRRHGASALDQLGPPNLLLVNRGGGRFEPAPENATVGIWRNSLQATWCDYNGDGRSDLYLANDWGMNVLFRNDGPAGFTDVTAEAGFTFYGFSMGASWGDYDNDGRDDLYVSNMYSEAGRRMTARIVGLDPQFGESAGGNFLYHAEANGKFRQVAGVEPPAMTVMKAGWSWGGCFADFDNDGYLDLYVLNGYFTAPTELASGLDLESNLWRTMVRADPKLTRPGFRFSPEWKRTPPPDNRGPQIDARMSGVERAGDTIRVHSLHGNERNRYFSNRRGRSFSDASGVSGLDSVADSRGFARLDYDRDGWQDVALVNANQPLFALHHNEMPAAGVRGGVIAVRFVGGNRTPESSREFTCRDGYGARVTVDLGGTRLVREHRCGEGWSVQNSATMLVGIGDQKTVASVAVRWPSGKVATSRDISEGTLLTVHENPSDSPSGEAFTRGEYRAKPKEVAPRPKAAPEVFGLKALDTSARASRLRTYTTFSTGSQAIIVELPVLRRLKDELGSEGVDVTLVPIDSSDDQAKLAAYARQWKPTSRLVPIAPDKRQEALVAFSKVLGQTFPSPSTVITDGEGHVLSSLSGVPSVSSLRALLHALR